MDSSAWSAERRSDALSSFLRTGRTHRTHAAYPRYGHLGPDPEPPPGTTVDIYVLKGTNGRTTNEKFEMKLTYDIVDFEIQASELELPGAYTNDQISKVNVYMKPNQMVLRMVGNGRSDWGTDRYIWAQEKGTNAQQVVYRIALTMDNEDILAFSVVIPIIGQIAYSEEDNQIEHALKFREFFKTEWKSLYNEHKISEEGVNIEEQGKELLLTGFVRELDSFKKVTDEHIMRAWKEYEGIKRLFINDEWIVTPYKVDQEVGATFNVERKVDKLNWFSLTTTPKVLTAIYRIRTVEQERIILTQVAGTPMNVSGESDSNEWTINRGEIGRWHQIRAFFAVHGNSTRVDRDLSFLLSMSDEERTQLLKYTLPLRCFPLLHNMRVRIEFGKEEPVKFKCTVESDTHIITIPEYKPIVYPIRNPPPNAGRFSFEI